jgi:hypothetical protein
LQLKRAYEAAAPTEMGADAVAAHAGEKPGEPPAATTH